MSPHPQFVMTLSGTVGRVEDINLSSDAIHSGLNFKIENAGSFASSNIIVGEATLFLCRNIHHAKTILISVFQNDRKVKDLMFTNVHIFLINIRDYPEHAHYCTCHLSLHDLDFINYRRTTCLTKYIFKSKKEHPCHMKRFEILGLK